jgi:hypothetical protein
LNRLQIVDHRRDVLRAEHEDRHIRMARHDALGERFGEILHGVLGGKGPERRRLLVRTVALFADGVAACAILFDERLALGGHVFLGCLRRMSEPQEHEASAEHRSIRSLASHIATPFSRQLSAALIETCSAVSAEPRQTGPNKLTLNPKGLMGAIRFGATTAS